MLTLDFFQNYKNSVSILVFVELALDVSDTLYWKIYAMFQSLFSWNLLLMQPSRTRAPLYYRVSILVFVELALDGYPACVPGWDRSSFNPCFRGTCS